MAYVIAIAAGCLCMRNYVRPKDYTVRTNLSCGRGSSSYLLLVQGRAKFCIYIWKPICAAVVTAVAAYISSKFQVVSGLTSVFPLVGIVWLIIIWTEHGEAYMTGVSSAFVPFSR